MRVSYLYCLGLVLAMPVLAETLPVTGDSLVLAGTAPGKLCYDAIDAGTVKVRSNFDPEALGTVLYEAGRDYVLDAAAGTLARTPDSRIPDFSTNVLYGKQAFDHSQFPGYGNRPFLVFVDYKTEHGFSLTTPSDQQASLSATRKKLETGGAFKIITFGDSISAGGEATATALRFDERYAAHLRALFPKAEITVENGATGGDATVQGLARLEEKVLTRAPDLVLVGFGMNDHNVGGVTPEQFESNLVSIAQQIHVRTGADVLMFSAFPPNPDWKFGSHRMGLYAAATQRAAERSGAGFADVFAAWSKVLQRKDPSSLLGNNINHPNDFGHWIYSQCLESVRF